MTESVSLTSLEMIYIDLTIPNLTITLKYNLPILIHHWTVFKQFIYHLCHFDKTVNVFRSGVISTTAYDIHISILSKDPIITDFYTTLYGSCNHHRFNIFHHAVHLVWSTPQPLDSMILLYQVKDGDEVVIVNMRSSFIELYW